MSSEHLFIISQIKLPELLPDARNEIPDTRYFWKCSTRARPMPEHAQKYPLDARKIDARPFPTFATNFRGFGQKNFGLNFK